MTQNAKRPMPKRLIYDALAEYAPRGRMSACALFPPDARGDARREPKRGISRNIA